MKITVFIVVSIFYSCILHSQNNPKFRIDQHKSYGGNVSDFFESVEYIPLETTKESLFGTPTNLIITDSNIVVSDFDTYSLLFFRADGTFIKKYSIPKPGNRGISLDYYDITKTIVLDMFPLGMEGLREVRVYSQGGHLVSTTKEKYAGDNIARKIFLDSGFYALHKLNFIPIKNSPQSNSISLVEVYNKSDRMSKSFLPLKPDENPFLFAYRGGVTMSTPIDSKEVFFVVPYDYRLFSLTKDTIKQLGQFVFPATSVIPVNILKSKKISMLDSLGRSMGMNVNLIETVGNLSFLGNRMFFTLEKKLTLRPSTKEGTIYDPLNFMYDTVTHKLVSFERITPGPLSYYLPIMDGFSSTSGMNHRGSYIYSSISSLQMFQRMQKNIPISPQYPPILQDYFKTQSRKSNPVIVKMKLKD